MVEDADDVGLKASGMHRGLWQQDGPMTYFLLTAQMCRIRFLLTRKTLFHSPGSAKSWDSLISS